MAGAGSDWDDSTFLLVFILLQWMNWRNVAAMAVLQAAAALPGDVPGVCSALFLLTGAVLHSMSLTCLAASAFERQMDSRRRIWVLACSAGVWHDLQKVGGRHEKVFQRFCRLPRPLFNDILCRIGPHIQRQATNRRQSVPAGQKFACALIRWATGGFYRQTAHGLGMGLASALRSNEDVADALITEYGHLMQFPTGDKLQECLDAFERKGFTGCVGAIGCTHVSIEKPRNERGECYYDRNGQFSIVAQVVCDHECPIVSAYVGCPGSVHDRRVLPSSPLYRATQQQSGVFGMGGEVLRDGRAIGRYLLADAGYPNLPWLMTPVGGTGRTPAEQVYDDCHTSARFCIERTFGRLKAVWRHFIMRQICNLRTLRKEFFAICILHNIMVNSRVEVDPDLLSDESDTESPSLFCRRRRRPVRRARPARHPPPPKEDAASALELGKELRESLIGHVWHHSHVHGAPRPKPWGM
ncbi:hypothetical protein CBR_g44324 [Chara braunii]|uniref:DDE Tnp4 domain-containing protein n=1 Tax=Chara braunii TaxID=69332 RepID=A0A388K366_CHABU|nr:hypothetical protein CBR_g44324 [Chara braunii]|eukprot:GBG64439.1 hypothetical protein CBR_g44324 [Chara braunii]